MKPSYEELEEQLNRSRRLCDAALANERVWETTMMQACGEDGPKSVADKFAELEARCAALAAENAGLKADKVRIFNSGYQRGHEATVEGYYIDIHQNDITTYHEDIVAEIAEEQTPATDAFLAEVRAQARTDFIGRIEWIIRNECNPEKTETILNELQSFSETVSQESAQ
ncbi:hypothetical protein UXP39_12555 [Enterobacter sichuanensis]|uniref:hypothetical protein n=1 Tax=Enterobacter sichuanensis TaxID=2071710 RepID=UPI002FD15FFC